MKGRTEIINYLIKKYNYKSYLEIGIAGKDNFNAINCEYKIGVDPAYNCDYKMSSDEFFKINKEKFDIIFIDGLHLDEQVRLDFISSTEILNSNGIILLHDCLPTCEEHQLRGRVKGMDWTGDTWKAIVKLRKQGWVINTINYDWGISVYQFASEIKPIVIDKELTYQNFEINKYKWLNIITLEQFYECY